MEDLPPAFRDPIVYTSRYFKNILRYGSSLTQMNAEVAQTLAQRQAVKNSYQENPIETLLSSVHDRFSGDPRLVKGVRVIIIRATPRGTQKCVGK